MPRIIFDIETGPLPDSELESMLPIFDPSEVKVGNIKDPEKIAAKIEEARLNHAEDFKAKAALSPLTGRVIAIGIKHDKDGFGIIADQDESAMLQGFWDLFGNTNRPPTLIGFNSNLFDLPFLWKRSWKHNISPPGWFRSGRYWSDASIDLRDVWQMGDRQAHGSLDSICKMLGLGGKAGNGSDFALLWQTDRPKAIEYLKQDINLTEQLFIRLIGRY